MKSFVTKLMKIHDDFLRLKTKNNTSGQSTCYEFLIYVVNVLQLENYIPIAIFNPM